MYVDEINGYKWVVNDDLIVQELDLSGMALLEQEFSVLVVREPFEDGHTTEISCSDQRYLTKLKNSEYFTLNKITISNNPRNKGYILIVEGYLEETGLTLRQKKPVFSEEEKKKRADRARENLGKSRTKIT